MNSPSTSRRQNTDMPVFNVSYHAIQHVRVQAESLKEAEQHARRFVNTQRGDVLLSVFPLGDPPAAPEPPAPAPVAA